jgi:transcriptional regulator with XRE-family HTH domain
MYPNLKIAIFKKGLRQNHLAKDLGMNDALLSKIIHGFREPTNEQKALIATYLGEDPEWLFEKFETAVAARATAGGYTAGGKEHDDS